MRLCHASSGHTRPCYMPYDVASSPNVVSNIQKCEWICSWVYDTNVLIGSKQWYESCLLMQFWTSLVNKGNLKNMGTITY